MRRHKTKSNFRYHDRIRISDDEEVEYWKNKFSVSESELIRAIAHSSNKVKSVERELLKSK